jgi:uncharacterized protein YdhG (YjbR/CyaY superfamily)
MPKSNFKSVDDYLAAQPEKTRRALKSVRSVIRKALPRSEEVISYQIPAYKIHGRVALYFAGWAEHYSIYPAGQRLPEQILKELAPYEMSKGTIRFPLSEPVPTNLIAKIAKFRAMAITERQSRRKS